MAGRPLGSKNKDKPWSDALRLVVNREDPEGKRALLKIAERCVEAAIEGKMDAIREIGDRLDGRPAQESTVTIDDKRDAADWSREELVAFLNDARAGGEGASKAKGSGGKPDRVH